MMTKLPYSLDELTLEWLQAALEPTFPGLRLAAAGPEAEIVGTASKIRFQLEFDEGGDAGCPSTLIVKGGFHGPEQLALSHGGYANEAHFYAELAPHLAGMELPRAYYASHDRETGQGVVLMEDLGSRNASFGRATNLLTVDAAAATLEWLAGLHGRFWNSPQLADLRPWPGVIETISDYFLTGDFWEQMTSRPLAHAVPAKMRNVENVRRALHAMWDQFRHRRETFVHGDSHLGNLYFLPDGTTAYLDWQSPMAGPAMDDVTYFLIGSLSIEDRRANEQALLRHYLEVVGSHPEVPDLTFDAAWFDYRRQVMHGFMWVATPPSMQPDDIVEANTTLFSTAFEDLETLAALGVVA